MNQKNVFSVISAVLILQGIAFFVIGDKMITDTFPAVTGDSHRAMVLFLEVPSALSILLGLIAYASRTNPAVLWAFTIGTGILLCITFKHLLVDHINVPIPAVIIQVLIFLSCGYLWLTQKKT